MQVPGAEVTNRRVSNLLLQGWSSLKHARTPGARPCCCACVRVCACVCVRSVVSANISDVGFHSEINASFRAISTRATQFEIPASLCHEMLGYPGVHVDHVSA